MIIFVYDSFSERLVSYLKETASNKDISFIDIRTDQFGPDRDFKFSTRNNKIHLNVDRDVQNVTGLFCKFTQLPSKSKLQSIPNEYKQYASFEIYDALVGSLLALCPNAHWINRPDAEFFSHIKIRQLNLATSLGFHIPNTVITCNKKRLVDFWKENNGSVVTKAIHRGWVAETKQIDENWVLFTTDVQAEHLKQLNENNWPPILFQQKIKKQYELRVLVVGDKCFVAQLDSKNVTDWRVDEYIVASSNPINIPTNIADACIKLTSKLGLALAAIDIIVDVNNNYYFLEANSQGGWEWMDINLGFPVRETIINELTSHISV
ncbi:MAG: hypothetical protein AB2552_01085 [Candidatus Thiodiazotropha endolucinida]